MSKKKFNLKFKKTFDRCRFCNKHAKWAAWMGYQIFEERFRVCTGHLLQSSTLRSATVVEKFREVFDDTVCNACGVEVLVGYSGDLGRFLCNGCAADAGVRINHWYAEPNETDDRWRDDYDDHIVLATTQEGEDICEACGSTWLTEKVSDPSGKERILCLEHATEMRDHIPETVDDPYPQSDPAYGSEDFDIIMQNPNL